MASGRPETIEGRGGERIYLHRARGQSRAERKGSSLFRLLDVMDRYRHSFPPGFDHDGPEKDR
jgi:hypothetical protein